METYGRPLEPCCILFNFTFLSIMLQMLIVMKIYTFVIWSVNIFEKGKLVILMILYAYR